MLRLRSWTMLAIALSGCTSYRPEDISGPKVKIEDAFDGVAKGLRRFQASLIDPNGEGGPLFLGVRTCKVTVQFNVSVQATDKGTAGVTLGYAPYIQANAGKENTSGANSGNLVTVELDGTDTKICRSDAKPPAEQKLTSPETPAPPRAATAQVRRPTPQTNAQSSDDARLEREAVKLKGTPMEQNLDRDTITGKICYHRDGHKFAYIPIPPCSGDM